MNTSSLPAERSSSSRYLLGACVLFAVLVAGYLLRSTLLAPRIDEIVRQDGHAALPEVIPAAGDWPWWRGPFSNQHAATTEAPLRWSETENVRWKVPLPGLGHSTPIIVGERIFLTTADEEAKTQSVLCLHRDTGAKIWETVVHLGGLMAKHPENSHASGTPACDGERLFVQFLNSGAQRLSALNLDGKILWQTEVGPHQGGGSHGSGPSPILFRELVIVNGDSPQSGFVAAVHRQSGAIVWRKPRRSVIGSYGTPTIATHAGQTLLILAGNYELTAYDPMTGEQLWATTGLDRASGNTPTVGDGVIVASTGYDPRILAVDFTGKKLWDKRGSDTPYCGSMIFHEGHLYWITNEGRALCVEAKTGVEKWSERFRGSHWSSPILVGSRIFAANREGTTTVYEARPTGFRELARNQLSEGMFASPVLVQGRWYLRTVSRDFRSGHLYCIETKS